MNPSGPERRHPAAFPVDDRRVYDAYVASRQSAALAVGVRVGLFDLLDEAGALSPLELAEKLGFAERGVVSLTASLVALGLVVRNGDELTLADDAAQYLVRGRPGSLHGLIDMEVESFLSPAALLESLETGRPSVYGSEDPWEAHAADPDAARRFTAAMHAVSERPAAGFAEVVELRPGSRVLDVGGGSGALSIAIARAWPGVECVIWDLASVCALTREYASAAGVSNAVSATPGDMFGEPFPPGFDTVLLSQILHDWPPERGRELVAKAFDALPSGGRLLVHEKLVGDEDEAPGGPLANALVHLDMLVWTEGQQYSFAELEVLLGDAGFVDIERRATAGYWSVVVGVRGER